MRRFRIADRTIADSAPELPAILADAYSRKIRPLCLCQEPGLAMYIADVGDQYFVKRMPLSGSSHDPSCVSYERPDELTGLGELMGSAIRIDADTGMAVLKLGFSLSRRGPRAAATGERNPSDNA